MICWRGNLIYMNPALKISRMVMTHSNLWIDNLRSFYVWMMICNVVDVVCQSEINCCGLYRWSMIIVSCSCGGCICPSVLIYSGLCRNYNDSSCNVFKNEAVIWISFTGLCLCGGVLNLIWHGNLWEVCGELLGFLKEASCVDNP